MEPRRSHRPDGDRLPRPQGGGGRRAGDDVRLGVGRSDHPGLVRLDRAVGRTQRAGAARTCRWSSPARGALHLPDDPHGTPRPLPHVRCAPPVVVGSAGGVTPRGAGAARGRRATGDRRAVRRGRAATGAVRLGRRRGDVLRRPPDRAVLRSAGQHPHRRVRRQPGEPHPLRPRSARGRARGGVRRLHRRLPDDRRSVPDRRARAGGHDRDHAQPDGVRGRRSGQRQRRHRRDPADVRRTSCPGTSCPRGSTTSGRRACGRRSACRCSSPVATSSRRWPRPRWRTGWIWSP